MLEASFKKKLWHFDLEINLILGNEILVLWGPSGSGKTTVLQCLAGLRSPSSGTISLNRQLLYSSHKKVNVPTRLRNIGYLFQDLALFPHMSVQQNVIYGLKCQKSRSNGAGLNFDPVELLHSFGVGHLIDRYPRQLSGGEKQRVALARALAVQPQLLLLDEPFSALDRSLKINLLDEVKKLHRRWKIPFVLVTHDEEDATILGDRILFIEKGQSRENTSMALSS